MTMFFPSMYPSSRSPCLNASMRAGLAEAEAAARYPIRGTFFACCASAIPTHPTSNTKTERSPAHFRFWILDFRLFPEREPVQTVFSIVLLLNRKSKIGNRKSFNDFIRQEQHVRRN